MLSLFCCFRLSLAAKDNTKHFKHLKYFKNKKKVSICGEFITWSATGIPRNKCCEMGPAVYRPYPRMLESLIVYKCHYKGSTFFSVIKDLKSGRGRGRP